MKPEQIAILILMTTTIIFSVLFVLVFERISKQQNLINRIRQEQLAEQKVIKYLIETYGH